MPYNHEVFQTTRGKDIVLSHETQMDSGIILPPRPLAIVFIQAMSDRPPTVTSPDLILPSRAEIERFGQSSSESPSYHNYYEDLVEEASFSEPTLEAFVARSMITAKQIIDSYGVVAIEGGLHPDTHGQERIELEKILYSITDAVKEKEASEDNKTGTGFYL